MIEERRFSRQREAIIHNLRTRCDHPSADDIYNSIRTVYPNISLGTVYRNLNRLSNSGEISSFTIDGKERFDGNLKPHYHFFCSSCHQIFDVFDDAAKEFMDKVEDSLGCMADSAKIVISGKCKACLK